MPEKILIADDDLDTLHLVRLMLQRQGYIIRTASGGLQALAMAQSEMPDLILLDVMMPDIDGYDVARRLRADTATAGIPILMFTALGQIEDQIMGLEAGADGYLAKPTEPRELFAQIKAVLACPKRVRPAVSQSDKPGRTVGILAAKGGLGVTTLALNLGIALANGSNNGSQKDIIVAEFRPGHGTIALELGYLKPEGFNRLLEKDSAEITPLDIENELIRHDSGIRLLLSSYRPRDAQNASRVANFEAVARCLPQLARFVILDLGVSLPPTTEKVLKYCDEVILVAEPVPQSLALTKVMLNDLFNCGIGEDRVKIVLVNRVCSGMQLSLNQSQEQLGRKISMFFTPEAELAYQALSSNIPLILQQPDCLTAQQFEMLAENVRHNVH